MSWNRRRNWYENSMSQIKIQFTRFSAFYSPLITTIAGGFLDEEGLTPMHSVCPPSESAIDALVDGSAHVVQSALSQGLSALEQGNKPRAVHFAQINEKDGFFLTGREPNAKFNWNELRGKKVLVDHGGQPLAMFKFACHRMDVPYGAIESLDEGNAAAMDASFRAGKGDFIHQQGPAPQQLEHDQIGHVVASVGEAIGPCGFSSLAATRAWLETDMARAFMRAYRKARVYINETSATEIAKLEAKFFPGIDQAVLTKTVDFYQQLGCWTPHVEITHAAYEVTLDVFEYVGRLKTRHPYEEVCTLPPSDE